MLKTYTAKTELSFNVRVGDAWAHVSFVPLTLGGSYFTTSDRQLQAAIERHRFFGQWIRVSHDHNDQSEPATCRQVTPDTPHEHSPEPLTFVSLADAKEWIASEYGISRTVLRTRAQIETVALEHGRQLIIDNPSTSHQHDIMERP